METCRPDRHPGRSRGSDHCNCKEPVHRYIEEKSHLHTVELDEGRDDAVAESATDTLEREERFKAVERIIEQRLTPLQRQILHMKEYEGKEYDEIAAKLGMQPPAVRMQLSRARKEIRECYLKQMER